MEETKQKLRLHRRAKCKGPKTHKLKCRSLKNIHAWYPQSEWYTVAKNKYSKKFTFNTLYGERLLISFDSNRGVSISRIINSLEMNKRRYNFREYCSSKRSAIAYYKNKINKEKILLNYVRLFEQVSKLYPHQCFFFIFFSPT